jgi:OOP family OmpA-OmpF porin
MIRRCGKVLAVVVGIGALSGCQNDGRHGASNAQAGNDRTPILRPAASPTPAAAPSPRSIMQPSMQPTPTPTPLAPLNETIHFARGGSTLDDSAKAALDQLVASPQAASGGAITLRGSTDSRGDDSTNLAISRRRAEAVAAYLESKGIDKARLTVVALGEGWQVVPEVNPDGSDNVAGREANRRVDITVTPQPPTQATDDDDDGDEAAAPPQNAQSGQ